MHNSGLILIAIGVIAAGLTMFLLELHGFPVISSTQVK